MRLINTITLTCAAFVLFCASPAIAKELSPEIEEVARKGFLCSEKNDLPCAVKNYRKVLNSDGLSDELETLFRTSQITLLSMLLSEQGEGWPAKKFAEHCEYGIRLVKEANRERGQQATIFYVRGMIGQHELGNYKRKKELVSLARTAMRASHEWNEIDGDVSNEVVRLTKEWANTAIDALK